MIQALNTSKTLSLCFLGNDWDIVVISFIHTGLRQDVLHQPFQLPLFGVEPNSDLEMKVRPLFKYIGSKYRSAEKIASYFPKRFKTYYEPFAGSLAVLGAIKPSSSVAGDIVKPLIDLWILAQRQPDKLLSSYEKNYNLYIKDRQTVYENIKESFNKNNNPYDFLFISRTCYGGVIRFRKDGYLSTPIGCHHPISPESLAQRMKVWSSIISNTCFFHSSFEDTIEKAGSGDLIYCDPPYSDTQKILYGAQSFSLNDLFQCLQKAKSRGAYIVLSIDGTKKSGSKKISFEFPDNLFFNNNYLSLGGSMLKRFSCEGLDMVDEFVSDRLLLSYDFKSLASKEGLLEAA